MRTFTVPTKDEVTENNKAIFANLQKNVGFVPNLYAYYAKNETALGDYLTLQNRKSTLNGKEREIINLVTSQINDCKYCQSAHTAIGKMNGFSDEEILEIRTGRATFNTKFDALAQFVAAVVENKGKTSETARERLFEAGYTEANMIDIVMVIGDKTISNYINNLTHIEIDFPVAPVLEEALV